MRGEEGDPWARSERQYTGRPQGDASGFDRGGPRGRRHTRWDPADSDRNKSQMAVDSSLTREMNEFYGRGQEEPSGGYFNNQMESERQREFAPQGESGWGRDPARRQQDAFYGMERQQMTETMSAYRPDNGQLMRHESGRSAHRPEEERMPPRLDRDRMPVRSDGERVGVGTNSERVGASEWMAGRSESERVGMRADRVAVSDRQGVSERGGMPDRMGGADRLGASGRMGRPDQGRVEAFERGGIPDRPSMPERRGGTDKMGSDVGREWPGLWPESEMGGRSENERRRMREDSSRWAWHQDDTQRRSESGRMGVQPDRGHAGVPPDNRMDGRERQWGEQLQPREAPAHYYDQGRAERGKGTADGKPLLSSHQASTSHQTRWESRDSARGSNSQYDPYSQQRDAFREEPSRYPQQPDPYRSNRMPDNTTQSRGGHSTSQSYPPPQSDQAKADQARRQSREYESYSPTKPQIYEGDDYSQGPPHYPTDRRPHDPQSHRSSHQAYSAESFGSQKYASSSQFQDPQAHDESTGRRQSQSQSKPLSYRPDYQSDYPRDSSQNPRYAPYSQSRSNPSGYNQPTSDWTDTHSNPHSSSAKPSYDVTEASKPNQTSTYSSSQPTPSDPQPSEPPASGATSGDTSGPVSGDASAHSGSDPTAASRVYVTSSPTVFSVRPVNAMAGVQLRPPVYGYTRQPLLMRPQVGLPGLRGE